MNDDHDITQRKNPRGSSPPHISSEEEQAQGRARGSRKDAAESRWTIWQAAYRLRRLNTFLRLLGPAVKGRG